METLSTSDQLMQILFAFAPARAIGAAAEFRIADALKGEPKSAEELAKPMGLHARSLYRVLRCCASVGVFSEDKEHRFSLTPLAELLTTDHPASLKSFAEMITSDWTFQVWAELPYSVKTGKPTFDKVHGMSSFDYFWTHEKAGKLFNNAMTSNSAFASAAVVEAYDFSGFSKIVDVGGGHGFLLASILKKNPQLRGVLYEIPAIISEQDSMLSKFEVEDRCEKVAGNFFESVPKGGDAYIMKHIIHDWSDEQCTSILKNCTQAMTKDGKVLVVEMILPEGNNPSPAKILDLQMLLFLPGCERTEEEYRILFDKSGLRLNRIIPTKSPYSIIEGVRK
jgi:hypothetical protein